MADKFVRISQLPECSQFTNTDYLVIENDTDTWKIKMACFDTFIKNRVDIYEEHVIATMDSKLEEVQTVLSSINDSINIMSSKMNDFTNAEYDRAKAETDRIKNEELRQEAMAELEKLHDTVSNTQDLIVDAETERCNNENDRNNAENNRVNAENIRQQKDAEITQNEINRGLAETNRQTAETNRDNAETERSNNENDRITKFNQISNFFNAYEESLDNQIKEGTSNVPPYNGDHFYSILKVAIPKNADHRYEALLHITEVPSIEDFFVAITMSCYGDDGNTLTLYIPEIYENRAGTIDSNGNEISLKQDRFCACYTDKGDSYMFELQYNAQYTSCAVRTGIIWDNISSFKPTSSPLYSKTPNKENSWNGGFKRNNQLTTISGSMQYDPPSGFVNLIDQLTESIEIAVENAKPYIMYPVGSVYTCTKVGSQIDDNITPNYIQTIMGGGVWEELYDYGALHNNYAHYDIDPNTTETIILHYFVRVE